MRIKSISIGYQAWGDQIIEAVIVKDENGHYFMTQGFTRLTDTTGNPTTDATLDETLTYRKIATSPDIALVHTINTLNEEIAAKQEQVYKLADMLKESQA